jgi:2-polyprenyl-3-methyl-5-hydroxy-6-metoxy-1,4-benzoquinol methylase
MGAGAGSVRSKLQAIVRGGARAPLERLLRSARSEAVDSVCDEHRTSIAALAPRLRRGESGARVELHALAERAFNDMHLRVAARASNTNLAMSWSAGLDAWWRNTHELEYLDDPDLDPKIRLRIVSHLDGLNVLLGSYRLFFEYLVPLLSRERSTKILDLAAGHAGFALAALSLAKSRGFSMELTASDIKREYLELGARRAGGLGLAVEFRVQDALDLSNLLPGEYDILTCTQSLHHFTPGQVAVMFSEAARVAARGVLFIDGARSALNAAAIISLGLLAYRDRAFAHDAFVSFRRFFVAEELLLLARLGPWGERARACWIPPGHCLLTLSDRSVVTG